VKITELETIPLRLPFAQPFKISQGARETLETLIVRVHTDEGIIGIGETCSGASSAPSRTTSSR